MALSLTIAGTDRVSLLRYGTLKITTTKGSRAHRCDFAVNNLSPDITSTVVIADGATTYFDGLITGIRTTELASGAWYAEISGQDTAAAATETEAVIALSDRDAETTYTDTVADLVSAPYTWWRLGEASGITAVDEMGVQDGQYFAAGSTSSTRPERGVAAPMNTGDTAITCDGDEYVAVGANLLKAQVDLSIAAWAKSSYSAAAQMIYCERATPAANALYQFYLDTNGRPTFQMRDDAGTLNTIVPASGDWTDDAWHQFVVTKDNTAVVIYVDGVSVKTGTLTATDTLTGTLLSHIGHDPAIGSYFNGSLDEVMLWRAKVTDYDIRRLYHSKNIQRYRDLHRSYVYSGTVATLSGTVSTYGAGFVPAAWFGLTSTSSSWIMSEFIVHELTMTWENATTIRYTVTFGTTASDVPVKFADAFP